MNCQTCVLLKMWMCFPSLSLPSCHGFARPWSQWHRGSRRRYSYISNQNRLRNDCQILISKNEQATVNWNTLSTMRHLATLWDELRLSLFLRFICSLFDFGLARLLSLFLAISSALRTSERLLCEALLFEEGLFWWIRQHKDKQYEDILVMQTPGWITYIQARRCIYTPIMTKAYLRLWRENHPSSGCTWAGCPRTPRHRPCEQPPAPRPPPLLMWTGSNKRREDTYIYIKQDGSRQTHKLELIFVQHVHERNEIGVSFFFFWNDNSQVFCVCSLWVSGGVSEEILQTTV